MIVDARSGLPPRLFALLTDTMTNADQPDIMGHYRLATETFAEQENAWVCMAQYLDRVLGAMPLDQQHDSG